MDFTAAKCHNCVKWRGLEKGEKMAEPKRSIDKLDPMEEFCEARADLRSVIV